MKIGSTHKERRIALNKYFDKVCQWKDTFLIFPKALEDGSWAWLETVETRFRPCIVKGNKLIRENDWYYLDEFDFYSEVFSRWEYRRKIK